MFAAVVLLCGILGVFFWWLINNYDEDSSKDTNISSSGSTASSGVGRRRNRGKNKKGKQKNGKRCPHQRCPHPSAGKNVEPVASCCRTAQNQSVLSRTDNVPATAFRWIANEL